MKRTSVSKNLIYQRKLKGYSQEELARKTTVTVRTIQRIEKGDVQPHLQTVKLLAAALEIEIDDLLPLEDKDQENVQQKWLLVLHISPIIGFALPLFNILLPLFIWIYKKDDNEVYNTHGRTVLNFHLTMSILFVFSIISLMNFGEPGYYLFLVIIPFSTAASIINALRAVSSKKIFYPLTIPFVRREKSGFAKSSFLGIVFIFLLAGCQFSTTEDAIVAEQTTDGQKTNQELKNDIPVIRIDGTTIDANELTKKIHNIVEKAEVTGLAVSILNQNETIYQNTFGFRNKKKLEPLKINTLMYGASLSKAVFSIIVLQLVQERKIDLDVPLQDYLEKPLPDYYFSKGWQGFKDLKGDRRYEAITARMCLTHTTGFPNWRFLTNKGFDKNGKLYFKFEPGKRYSYSGEGFGLLQFVIEEIMGEGLENLAQERIFEPLGMDRTSYIYVLNKSLDGNYALGHNANHQTIPFNEADDAGAAGSLGTTPADYTIFLEAIMKHQLIKSTTFDKLREKQIEIRSKQQFGPNALVETSENEEIDLAYGLGWGMLTSPYGQGIFKEGHDEGFQHYSILFPEQEIGILLMSNSDNAKSVFKEILAIAIADIYTPWKWENYIPYNKVANYQN